MVLKNERNAWDALFLNSTIAIIALFMIGLVSNTEEIWLRIVSFIGIMATGSAIMSAFTKK